MSTEFEVATMYIDMDSLFDTRLATIFHHFGVEAAEKACANGYYNRLYDEFEGIDTEAYRSAYASRDLSVLQQAVITPTLNLVKLFAKQTLVALVTSPFRRQPKVVLNSYPYRLTDDQAKQFIAGLSAATDKTIDVELVYMPLEELTPSYVKANFIQMVMYSYWEWLETHSANKNFVDTQCPGVMLVGPAIMKSKEAAKQLKGIDAFDAVESYASLFVKLVLYPVNTYCVDLDRLKKRAQ